MGVTVNSVSSIRRQAGAEYLLLDSGAQLYACPLKYPGQKTPLSDPGIHTASEARLQHDGGRLVTYKLPEGRTIRVLSHACAVQKPILSLGRLTQQGYWSDLRADTGTLFFLDKTQTKRSHTQLHKEESLFFVKGTMVAPLTTAGVIKSLKRYRCQWDHRCWKTLRSRCLPVLQRSEIQALSIRS